MPRSSSHYPVRPPSEAWRDHAECRRVIVDHVTIADPQPTDPASLVYDQRSVYQRFYPTRHSHPKLLADAKRICSECPVRARCLEAALVAATTTSAGYQRTEGATGWDFGVQGGLTVDERRAVVKKRKRDANQVEVTRERRRRVKKPRAAA